MIRQFELVELRRYRTVPGRRDALIDLFERDLIAGQEACGMNPFGHFRDVDRPNAFVWFRGFSSMQGRRKALEAFYDKSDVWQNNREQANATMEDSDDVLLLREVRKGSGFDLSGLSRPTATNGSVASTICVTVLYLKAPPTESLVIPLEHQVLPALRKFARRVAMLMTGAPPNDYPRLPVREEHALVLSGVCADGGRAWAEYFQGVPQKLLAGIDRLETLRLEPAARSILR